MKKKTIAVLFGGQSSEHEISCVSATTIINHIDKDAYEVIIIGITREGHWIKVNSVEEITSGTWKEGKTSAILSPDASDSGILVTDNGRTYLEKVDVIFPALHGLYGEDGTVQGLIELSKIPYVGCGVLASAVSMDKFFTKLIVDTLNIRQAKYVPVLSSQLTNIEKVCTRVEEHLSYPVFVKPSNAGSSKGVSKADSHESLKEALHLAAKHDRKILVEETIIGREIECAVLGGQDPKASGVGEILAAAEFYDYDAKYNSADSKTVISPELPDGIAEEIRKDAVEIFQAVDGYGLSRVDFFVENGTNQVVFNEINTLPGFTGISMYPMLWEEKGMDKKTLIERLIRLSYNR